MNKIKDIKKLFLEITDTTEKQIKHINYNLNELMILEKIRLGFNENDLVFISAGDFSRFYWCSMQTYFACKKNELEKYYGYLKDKIEYSIKLNKIKNIPKTKEELIDIGNDLTLNDINELLKLDFYQNKINEDDIELAKKELEKCKTPIERGKFLEIIYARRLPQIHWVKQYQNFVFTCAPDGIDENYVYEFKSSKNNYFATHTTNKAKLQADIYGICFNKKNKVIEQLILSNNETKSYEEPINRNIVNYIILKLNNIINGVLPEPPKEKFKCRGCEFNQICKIKNN